MMNRILMLILLGATIGCKQKYQVQQAKQIGEEIRKEFAPDKRVALFRIDTIVAGSRLVLKGETTLPAAKENYLKRLENLGIAFDDSLELLPSPDLKGKHFGVVNVSVCNMRSKPDHAAELGTQALMGAVLRVWKKEGDFYLVQSPDDYFGWLDDGGFAPMSESELDEWQNSQRAVVTQDFVFVYENPDPNALKVTDLLAGNIVQVVENQGRFTKVKLPDGRFGFVESQYVVVLDKWLASRQATPANVLATAQEMMGRPYLWGGTSGKGVDCSGFTKTVFFLNGLQLPRDASQQVHVGELVDTDTTWRNLKPGDLLFYGRKATPEKRERISHVAIYLGDGKIIHASDRVKVESIVRGEPTFVEERLRTFVRAKRILGSEGKNGILSLSEVKWYVPKKP